MNEHSDDKVSDEGRLKALGFVVELCKQMITLATATVALTVAFVKDLGNGQIWPLLGSAWVAMFVCILTAAWTLMAVAGSAEKGGGVYDVNIKFPATGMVVTFVVGTVMMVLVPLFPG